MIKFKYPEAAQRMFNKIYLGLQAQGWKQSKGNVGGKVKCAYRGDDNRKCAIGHLIEDDHYKPLIENFSIGYDAVRLAVMRSQNLNEQKMQDLQDLLSILQRAHDHRDNPEAMQQAFQHEAEFHGLQIPETKA